MQVRFIDPLSRGWGRMKKALFNPFDLKKWFLVGFTAFLAGLADCYHGGGNGAGGRGHARFDFHDFIYFPRRAWEWLIDNPEWFTLIVVGIVFLFAIGILLLWLSSRGKFMFLNNVVHNRAEVSKPWYDFRAQGNSLFVWRFIFGLICFTLFILFFIVCFLILFGMYEDYVPRHITVFTIIGMSLAFLFLAILCGYISLFLDSFVVPIMVKKKLRTTQAWGRFLEIFKKHWFYFLLYGLFNFLLGILVIIFIIIAVVCTCCIGGILILIPYINAVALLPISYTFRAFSVEFLEQFGPDFALFPRPKEPARRKVTKK
jgi:hypothetical protein